MPAESISMTRPVCGQGTLEARAIEQTPTLGPAVAERSISFIAQCPETPAIASPFFLSCSIHDQRSTWCKSHTLSTAISFIAAGLATNQ
jgi:hypothetical protein